jgi:hypothetical protein
MSESSVEKWAPYVAITVIAVLIMISAANSNQSPVPSSDTSAQQSTAPSSSSSLGYNEFDEFGFSFKYPQGMTVSIYPVIDSSANEDSGMIMVGDEDDSSGYVVFWSTVTYPRDLEQSLEDGWALVSEGLGEDDWISPGLLEEVSLNGHDALVQYFGGVFEGEKGWGVEVVWNCDEVNTVFAFIVASDDNNIDDLLEPFISYFECH